MGRQKKTDTALPSDEEVLEAPPATPRTRNVEVNQVTRRRYTEQEPLEDDASEMEVVEDEAWADPFGPFNEIVGAGAGDATIRIWRLPRYDVDGKTAMRTTEREYCGSVPYSPDNAFVLDSIQARVPKGGMCTLELIGEGARVQRRGLIRIASTEPATPPATSNGQNPIVIQPAAPPVDPFATVKQQAESLVAVADLLRKLQPEPPPAPAPLQIETAAVAPRQQLFETVLVEMVKSSKPDSLDRVADLLSGGRESGWLETTIKEVAPHVGGFLNQIGPGLNMWLMRMAGGQPVAAPAGVATSSSPAPAGAAVDPSERAWRRVLYRLVDDLLENHGLLQTGQLGLDIHSSAEAVADLAARFAGNQQITATIEQLLTLAPAQVIDACCMMITPQLAERLVPLKEHEASKTWLLELQSQVREIQNESAPESPEPAAADAGAELPVVDV